MGVFLAFLPYFMFFFGVEGYQSFFSLSVDLTNVVVLFSQSNVPARSACHKLLKRAQRDKTKQPNK